PGPCLQPAGRAARLPADPSPPRVCDPEPEGRRVPRPNRAGRPPLVHGVSRAERRLVVTLSGPSGSRPRARPHGGAKVRALGKRVADEALPQVGATRAPLKFDLWLRSMERVARPAAG